MNLKNIFFNIVLLTVAISNSSFAQSGFPGMDSKFLEPVKSEEHPSIEVTLIDNKKTTCSLDVDSNVYICKNKKSPILIKNGPYGFMGITKDAAGSSQLVYIKEINSNSKKIFESSIPAVNKSTTGNTLFNQLTTKTMLINSFFGLDGFSKPVSKGSVEFEAIKREFLNENTELNKMLDKVAHEQNFKVTLKDGDVLNCSRLSLGSKIDERTRTVATNMGVKLQCMAFNCGDVKVGNETYQAMMMYESNPRSHAIPTVFFSNKNNLESKTVKKISSPSSKLPIVDNSFIIKNASMFIDPYKTYIKSVLPQKLSETFKEDYAVIKSPMVAYYMDSIQQLCNDDKKSLSNFNESKNNFMLKLAEMDLAEFISVLADGSLVGLYVDPSKAASLGCIYGGAYLDEKAAQNLNVIKKNIRPDLRVEQTITMDKATELFNRAMGMEDIAWGFKKDGCYARAHLMARRFEEEGIRVDKVWIKGDLYIPETDIRWNFHVAPVVYVKDEKNQIQKIVIDPSLFDGPVTVEEWDKKMAKNTAKGSVISVFPFPENAALMERSTLSFSSSDPYLPRGNINMTEEEKMGQAKVTMANYLEYEKEKSEW